MSPLKKKGLLMRKTLAQVLSFLFLISLSVLALQSCGSGAPPASIPAPVASFMTISPPDPVNGAVTINGAPGTVNPGATVQAKNITQAGPFTRWENPLLRKAFAQIFQAEVIADDQGAFTNLQVDGATGDRIGIRQEVGGEFSAVTELIVP